MSNHENVFAELFNYLFSLDDELNITQTSDHLILCYVYIFDVYR